MGGGTDRRRLLKCADAKRALPVVISTYCVTTPRRPKETTTTHPSPTTKLKDERTDRTNDSSSPRPDCSLAPLSQAATRPAW